MAFVWFQITWTHMLYSTPTGPYEKISPALYVVEMSQSSLKEADILPRRNELAHAQDSSGGFVHGAAAWVDR